MACNVKHLFSCSWICHIDLIEEDFRSAGPGPRQVSSGQLHMHLFKAPDWKVRGYAGILFSWWITRARKARQRLQAHLKLLLTPCCLIFHCLCQSHTSTLMGWEAHTHRGIGRSEEYCLTIIQTTITMKSAQSHKGRKQKLDEKSGSCG